MKPLSPHDLAWALRLMPRPVRDAMRKYGRKMVCAGGFVRAAIAREPVSDIDFFAPSKDVADVLAKALCPKDRKVITTDNAFTVVGHRHSLQFIHRWVFERPEDVIASFDFTVARAAFWWQDEIAPAPVQSHWESLCDDRYYEDLAAKRLVYCSPVRNEDAGGSMLRVLKFYQKGYRIPLDSLGAVIARLTMAVDHEQIKDNFDPFDREARVAKVLTALLVEVDPNVDPEHLCHLPTLKEMEAEDAAEKAEPQTIPPAKLSQTE